MRVHPRTAKISRLSDADHERLQREVAGLPSEIDTDEIESRMFDLTALRMQLALAEGNTGVYCT